MSFIRCYLFGFWVLISAHGVAFWIASAAYAADSTSFNPTEVAVVASPLKTIPIGTIVPWPSASLPVAANGVSPTQAQCIAATNDAIAEQRGCDWLIADGSTIRSAAYPDLAGIVGTKLPDYRGVFLRGHGAQTTGGVTHQSGGMGQLQQDAMRKTADMNILTYTTAEPSYTTRDSRYKYWHAPSGRGLLSYSTTIDNDSHPDPDDNPFDKQPLTIDPFIQIGLSSDASFPTANENRPINRAVTYLIRAR